MIITRLFSEYILNKYKFSMYTLALLYGLMYFGVWDAIGLIKDKIMNERKVNIIMIILVEKKNVVELT